MDPQATLKRYVDAFAESDEEEMARAAADYNVWISRAGFPAKLPDGREVYRLGTRPGTTTAVGAGDDAVYLTPQRLSEALDISKGSLGLKERLHAALQAHSGCCLDNDEEVDKVLAAIHEAAQPRTES